MPRRKSIERVTLYRTPKRNGNGEIVGYKSIRPPSLSRKVDELTDDFVNEFMAGATDGDACEIIGLSLTQFRRWMQRGKNYEEALAAEQDDLDYAREEVYYKFRRAVLRAKAKYRSMMRRSVTDAATNVTEDTKAGWLALEVLARRDSANWGREARSDSGNVQYDPDETFL